MYIAILAPIVHDLNFPSTSVNTSNTTTPRQPKSSPRSISTTHQGRAHLVKRSHGFIRAPNLHLVKRRPTPLTPFPRTLGVRLIGILPAVITHHVFDFFALHLLAFVVAAVDEEFVGAGATFKAILAGGVGRCWRGAGYGKGIGTTGADCRDLGVRASENVKKSAGW